jgi:filamentous hemagglutinin family protein
MNGKNPQLRLIERSLKILILLLCGIGFSSSAGAQITPDNTLGNGRSRLSEGELITGEQGTRIDGGTRRGANLFHSFSLFNVGEGQRVYFTNPDGVERVLTRVTGDRPSRILGTLGVAGNADLFLLNPNGIVFGSNAQLDIRGSFIASTADGIRFSNVTFSATDPQTPPLLTVGIPLGLQYGRDPGQIRVQGTRLELAEGETLALVGGAVNLRAAKLRVPDGRIELGSLSEPGTVSLIRSDQGLRLHFPADVSRDRLSIRNSAINVRSAGSGSIVLTAQDISISDESFLTAGIAEGMSAENSQPGTIELLATGNIDIARSNIFSEVQQGGIGDAGDILIVGRSLRVSGGTQLSTSLGSGADIDFDRVNGQGNAGNIVIRVDDTVSFEAGTAFSPSAAFTIVDENSIGNGGDIDITANTLRLSGGAQLASLTRGQGNAGNVRIRTGDRVILNGAPTNILSRVNPEAIGQGGNIIIRTETLRVTNGAQLTATTRGLGDAGNLRITARDRAIFDGEFRTDNFQAASGAFSRVSSGAIGRGGNITIRSGTLRVTNGAFLVTSTSSDGDAGNLTLIARDRVSFDGVDQAGNPSAAFSGVSPNATAGSDGGNITIRTRELDLTQGAELSAATQGQGNAGNIEIVAGDRIRLSGTRSFLDENDQTEVVPSRVLTTVEPGATGNGGNILIAASSLELDQGELTASTEGQGIAGNITIQSADRVALVGGTIATAVLADSAGQGGNIAIEADQLTLADNAQISAATVRNSGGSISLDNNLLFLRQGSQISTSAGTAQAGGNGGNINIASALVVAVPQDNSDITANAFTGRGGNIAIETQSILGLEVNNLPDRLPISEINASSQAGINGTVTINSPDVDPLEETAELPTVLSAPPLAQGCDAQDSQTGSFVNTGRGGVPPSPTDPLIPNTIWQDLQISQEPESESSTTGELESLESAEFADRLPSTLIEAQGWNTRSDGAIELVAQAPTITPYGVQTGGDRCFSSHANLP